MFLIRNEQLSILDGNISENYAESVIIKISESYPGLEYDSDEFKALLRLFSLNEVEYGVELFSRYLELGSDLIKDQLVEIRYVMPNSGSEAIYEAVRLRLNSITYCYE